jgi:hypothetical protein
VSRSVVYATALDVVALFLERFADAKNALEQIAAVASALLLTRRLAPAPNDAPVLVNLVLVIARHKIDYAANHLFLELLRDDAAPPDAHVVALRALSKILHDRADAAAAAHPPTPSPLPALAPPPFAGIEPYLPAIGARVVALLNSSYGAVGGLRGDAKDKNPSLLNVLSAAVACLPDALPDSTPPQPLTDLIASLISHPSPDVASAAIASLQRFTALVPSLRGVAIYSVTSVALTAEAPLAPDVPPDALALLTRLLALWVDLFDRSDPRAPSIFDLSTLLARLDVAAIVALASTSLPTRREGLRLLSLTRDMEATVRGNDPPPPAAPARLTVFEIFEQNLYDTYCRAPELSAPSLAPRTPPPDPSDITPEALLARDADGGRWVRALADLLRELPLEFGATLRDVWVVMAAKMASTLDLLRRPASAPPSAADSRLLAQLRNSAVIAAATCLPSAPPHSPPPAALDSRQRTRSDGGATATDFLRSLASLLRADAEEVRAAGLLALGRVHGASLTNLVDVLSAEEQAAIERDRNRSGKKRRERAVLRVQTAMILRTAAELATADALAQSRALQIRFASLADECATAIHAGAVGEWEGVLLRGHVAATARALAVALHARGADAMLPKELRRRLFAFLSIFSNWTSDPAMLAEERAMAGRILARLKDGAEKRVLEETLATQLRTVRAVLLTSLGALQLGAPIDQAVVTWITDLLRSANKIVRDGGVTALDALLAGTKLTDFYSAPLTLNS